MDFFSKIFSSITSSSYSLNTACFNVVVNPMDKKSYYSKVDVAELGNITLAIVDTRSSVVTRKVENFEDKEGRRFTFMYNIEGEITISNDQGMKTLKKGQFMLIDNSITRKMFVYDSVKMLLVCVTRAKLKQYLPSPEEVANYVIEETDNNGIKLFTPLLALWEHLKDGELDEFYTSIGEELLTNIGETYASHVTLHHRSRHNLRMISQIRGYIEAHLTTPDLSVEKVADEFRVSSRHLRSLFQGGEKLSQYILRRRLEESAKLLASPIFQSSSITEISYLCGFNSSTHFARCFKEHFKQTARDYRRKHSGMGHDLHSTSE